MTYQKMDVNGGVVLIKKKDAPVNTAKGIKIFPLGENGRPDYSGASTIIWKGDLDRLLAGSDRQVSSYLGLPLEQNTQPVVKKK